MPRCGHMFHDKCIQTWKASCKSEPSYGVCPQSRKPFRKFLSFYKLRGTLPHQDPKVQLIPYAGQHIDTAGTSSILYFETIVQLRVRRRYTHPPHLFTFYLTHAHFDLFFSREISLIFSFTFHFTTIAGTAQHSIPISIKESPLYKKFP